MSSARLGRLRLARAVKVFVLGGLIAVSAALVQVGLGVAREDERGDLASYSPAISWGPQQHGATGVWRVDSAEDGSFLCTVAHDGSVRIVDLPVDGGTTVVPPDPDSTIVDVACLPSRNVAVLAYSPSSSARSPRNGGVVRLIRPDGDTVWETRIPDSRFDEGYHATWSFPVALSRGVGGRYLYVLDAAAPRALRVSAASGRIDAENAIAPPGTSGRPHDRLPFDALADLDARGGQGYGDFDFSVLARVPGAVRYYSMHSSVDRSATLRANYAVPSGALRIASLSGGDVALLLAAGEILELDSERGAQRSWVATGSLGEQLQATDIAPLPNGRLVLADSDAGNLHLYERPGDGSQQTSDSQCTLRAEKWAEPLDLWLGEAVTLTLALSGTCPERQGADIVIAIDNSWSRWEASPLAEWDVASARDLLQTLEPGIHHLAALTYDEGTLSLHPMTTNPTAVSASLGRVQPPSEPVGNDAGLALRRAVELFHGLEGAGSRRRLVLVWGDFWQEPRTTLEIAASLHRSGIEIGVIHDHRLALESARAQDERFAALIASDEQLLWDVAPDTAGWLASAFRWQQPQPASKLIDGGVVTDTLPSNMRYLGSGDGPIPSWDDDTRTLAWSLGAVGFDGLRVSVAVEPLQVGMWPTNVDAVAVVTDGLGIAVAERFPVPRVSVRARPALTPDSTGFPTPTPTPTHALETTTPTFGGQPLFFPALLRQTCASEGLGANVVLVIDASSSMEGEKLADAKSAARHFVDLMRLSSSGDRVAVVSFASRADLHRGLTSDPIAIADAIDAISVAAGTRIDLGLRLAGEELERQGVDQGRLRFVVILTDGRQSEAEGEELAAASELREVGIRIFAIGLGADADRSAIAAIAGEDGRAYHAPGSTDLANLYRAVAAAIRCRPEPAWP